MISRIKSLCLTLFLAIVDRRGGIRLPLQLSPWRCFKRGIFNSRFFFDLPRGRCFPGWASFRRLVPQALESSHPTLILFPPSLARQPRKRAVVSGAPSNYSFPHPCKDFCPCTTCCILISLSHSLRLSGPFKSLFARTTNTVCGFSASMSLWITSLDN